MSRWGRLAALVGFLGQLYAPVHAGSWKAVGQGDCPGPQVLGSAGEVPEDAQCTPEFSGKTALCFRGVCNPGCQYIDVLTRECRGGAELADVYTCVPERPADGSLPSLK